jgi:hypothetical protein
MNVEAEEKGGVDMSIDQIAYEALMLGTKDRAVLAETIWESLGEPFVFSSDLSDEQAMALAKNRDQEMENETVTSLSHQELMERLRR